MDDDNNPAPPRVFGPVIPHAERMGKACATSMCDMNDYIESLDAEQLVAYVNALYKAMQVPGATTMVPSEYMQLIGTQLGFSFDKAYDQGPMLDFCTYNMQELVLLRRSMNRHKLFEAEAERRWPDIRDVWDKFYTVVSLMHAFNRAVALWGRCHLISSELENPTGFDPRQFGSKAVGERGVSCPHVDPDDAKLQENQVLLLFLLNAAYEKEYRKSGDYLYRRVVVKSAEGGAELKTHAWEEVMKMDEFVRRSTPKELDIAMWRCAHMRSCSVPDAAKELAKCVDPELPTLAKDRNVFAFSNGTYVAWAAREEGGPVTDLFVPYQLGPGERPLHKSVVAANYFKQPLDVASPDTHWAAIATPSLDKILDTQLFPPEVKRWMYVFFGRLLHELGDHDAWQVIPFLKGVGGCGKSTLINDVCGIFYHKHDTAVLSNNCEKRFGLSGLVDKFMFLAPEIKSDLQLEQAEFQSMVSGEDVQVNVKHETAHSITWKTPGILGGNELPGWCDNSGSIARRVVIFNFKCAVPDSKGDTELKPKLRKEIGNILQKCSRAYIEAVQQVGSDNVWQHLPPYFHKERDQLRMDTNSLEHFLGNHEFTFGPEEYMPRDQFQQAYQLYCTNNGLQRKAFNEDTTATPFARYDIHRDAMPTRRIYPRGSGSGYHTTYLRGVDIREPGVTGRGNNNDDDGGGF